MTLFVLSKQENGLPNIYPCGLDTVPCDETSDGSAAVPGVVGFGISARQGDLPPRFKVWSSVDRNDFPLGKHHPFGKFMEEIGQNSDVFVGQSPSCVP